MASNSNVPPWTGGGFCGSARPSRGRSASCALIVVVGHPDLARPHLPLARRSAWRRSHLDGGSRVVRDWLAARRDPVHLRPAARRRRRARSFPAREMPQIQRRGGALRQADPDGVAAGALLARRERPALVGLRDVVPPPDALLRDVHRRRGPLGVRARALLALRDDGLRARADGLRDVRALSGGAAVDGGAARQPRRVEPDDRADLAPHPGRRTSGACSSTVRAYANNVAAMPSLHAAFALLFVALPLAARPALGPARCSRSIRPAMALALVYSRRALRRRLHRRLGLRGVRVLRRRVRVREACSAPRSTSSRRSSIERDRAAALLRRHRRRRAVARDRLDDRDRRPGRCSSTPGWSIRRRSSTPSWGPVIFDRDGARDLVAVINTHLHFDHCGGNRRYAGLPTYVQRRELETARRSGLPRGMGAVPGESYVELDGDAELFDGVSVLFTPGHSVGPSGRRRADTTTGSSCSAAT